MTDEQTNMSVLEFAAKYATVDSCLAFLREVRWADCPYCPHCGSIENIYHFSDGRRHKCKECGRTFRLITGTIFADTPIKILPKWFMAIYLDATHSKGISSVQLAKDVGVTQKTAWHMLQRIRHAAGNASDEPLSGIVEVDETYLGGKRRNMSNAKRKALAGTGRGAVGKQAVLGMKERGGRTVAMPVAGSSHKDLQPPIVANVEAGSRVHTDEHGGYLGLPFPIEKVRHSTSEYVRGDVHTNGIESFWATIKRCYVGTHHWWSNKHTARYIEAAAFRQNHKHCGQHERVGRVLAQGIGTSLPYRTLVDGVAA